MLLYVTLAAGIVLWLGFAVVGAHRRPVPQRRFVDPTVTILRERFARGEIDAATYYQLISGLTRP